MSVKNVASYWSATAHIGRSPVYKKGGVASYWSATADIGRERSSSLRDTVIEATYYNSRGTPYVNNRGDAGSAYRTQQTLADLEKMRVKSPLAGKLSFGDERALNNQLDFLDGLRKSLINLSDKIKNIRELESFNPWRTSVAGPEGVSARANIFARAGDHGITVERLARTHKIASSQQADEALNLSGTFSINGYSITVSATDTLADIRDKINQGEDANENDELETQTEDLNQNGSLDFYYQPPAYVYGQGKYLPAFSYFEDIDADKTIDASEDLNNSGTLDGGTTKTRARATITDSRLIIENLRGADTSLSISDPDDVLESLGFYKTSAENVKHLKTEQDSEYHQDPVTAKFTVDGFSLTSNTNVITDVIPGVELTLRSTTSREVTLTVTKNADQVVENVKSFSDAFNGVVRKINDQNVEHLPPQDNVRIQDFTIAIARFATEKVESIAKPPDSLDDIGLEPVGSSRKALDVASIKALGSDGGAAQLDKKSGAEPGLFGKLGRIGVETRDDFTLALNKDKLKKEIDKSPSDVFTVFNAIPDGVALKLEHAAGYALNQSYGMIEYQKNVVENLKKSPDFARKVMSAQVSPAFEKTRLGVSRYALEEITQKGTLQSVKA